MPDVLYRSILDASDVMTKIALIESRLLGLGTRTPVPIRVDTTAADAAINSLQQRIARLGGNTQRITLNMSAGAGGRIDPLLAQLTAAERQLMRLSLASSNAFGMTQRLSGLFAFIPGPIGLYASAASLLTGSLTTLTAAQKLNAIGTFTLAGGLAAIGLSVTALAVHGIKQLNEFQAAVNTLNAQGEGLGNGFDSRVRALQESGGRAAQQFNRAELGGGVADLTKQGLEEADAMKLVATSYKLAGAEGQKLNDSSTLLLSNLRQFGLDGPKAADEAAHFGDVLAKGSLQAASGAKELQVGLSVVGPAAHAMGLSLEETIGYLVALDNAGLKASTIGANAFRAVLLALASPTGVARAEMTKLGVALKNADGSARPVRDILIDLREAAKKTGSTYDESTKAMVRTADSVSAVSSIFRSRGVVGFLNMTDAVENYTAGLNGSSGALDKYANALTEGPLKAQERLRKSVDDLSLSFAETFGPKLSSGLDSATKLFRDIDKMTQHPETLKAYFDVAVTGFGALTGAIILNSEAAKGLLAVNSWSGFVTLLQGTVAGGLFTKAAAGLRALALAQALNSFAAGGGLVGGIKGLVMTLASVPLAAGAALAGVALLAGGVAVYGKKIAADTQKIYDDLEDSQNRQQRDLLARVADLRKQGPLGQLKAKQLLTIDLRFNYENSPERNAQLDATLLKLKGQIKAEQDHQATLLAAAKTKQADKLATEEQTVAYDSLKTKLDEIKSRFGEMKTTAFQKGLQDARKALEDFNKEVAKQVASGDITPVQGQALTKRATAAQPEVIQSLVSRQLDADKTTIEGHQREIEQARLTIVKDGAEKRRREYQQEITDLNGKYSPQIKEALANAQTKGLTSGQKAGFLGTAGKLQLEQADAQKAAAAKLASDLRDIEDGRTKKVRDTANQNLNAYAAEMSGRAAIFQTGYKRAQDMASDDAARRLTVERQMAPQLEALQLAARNAKLVGERMGLRNELDDALKAAENQGAQTATLKAAANQKYLTDSRVLEQAYQNDVQGYHLATLSAIQQAGADVTKKQLDLELAGIKQWTGVQLSAYENVLRAKMRLAEADGDGPRYKVLAEALKGISEQKFSNLVDFKKNVSEGAVSLAELRGKLAELNPNKDAKRAAETTAANPFNSLITDAQKRFAGSQEAFSKLDPAQQAQQLTAYRQQQGEITRLMLDAGRQRNVAVAAADAEFEEKRIQKAAAASLKLAQTGYDRTKDSASYLQALAQDTAFWQARLKIAQDGSQEQQTAEQHISENDSARKAVLETDQKIADGRRQLAHDEAASSLELAQTEAQRVAAQAQLVALDQQRLASLPALIAASKAVPGNEEQTNALIREQLALRATLKKYSEDELARADAHRAAQRDELQASLDLARTDSGRAAIRGQLLERDQAELSIIQQRLDQAVAEGATQEKIAELTGRRDALQKSLLASQTEETQRSDELLASQVKLLEARHAFAASVAQSNAEVLAGKRSAVADTQKEADLIAQQLAQAKERGLSEAQIDDKKAELIGKQLSIYEQQKAIREYLLSLDRDSLALLESQIRLQATASGASNDPIQAKQAELDSTRRQVAQLQNEQRGASEADQVKLQTQINGLLADEITKQRELVNLDFQRQQSRAALADAQARLSFQMSAMSEDAVASAQMDAEEASHRKQNVEAEIQHAIAQKAGEAEINNLLAKQAQAIGDIISASKKLFEAEKARVLLMEQLGIASVKVQRALGAVGDASAGAKALDPLNGFGKNALSVDDQLSNFVKSRSDNVLAVQKLRGQLSDLYRNVDNAAARFPTANNIRSDYAYDIVNKKNALLQANLTLADSQLKLNVYTELADKNAATLAESQRAQAQQIGGVMVPALQGELDARTALAAAVAAYGGALTAYNRTPLDTSKAEKLKTASDALSAAADAQRASLRGVADAYRTVVSQMDGVRTAAERLNKAAYGDNQAFNPARELNRLDAITARRSAAQQQLQKALQSGVASEIQKAAEDLTGQQERYNAQIKALQDKGLKVVPDNNLVQSLADTVDALGIRYDRDSVTLTQRAAQLDQEAKTTSEFGNYVAQFEASVQRLNAEYQTGKTYTDGNFIDAKDLKDYFASRPTTQASAAAPKTPPPPATQVVNRAGTGNDITGTVIAAQIGGRDYTTYDSGRGGELPALALSSQYRDLQEQLKTANATERSALQAKLSGVQKQLDSAETAYMKAKDAARPIPPQAVQAAVATLAVTPPNSPNAAPAPQSVNNAKTITVNNSYSVTVNATSKDGPDIAQAVRAELAQIDRDATIYGECP